MPGHNKTARAASKRLMTAYTQTPATIAASVVIGASMTVLGGRGPGGLLMSTLSSAAGGAIAGGVIGGIVEYTINKDEHAKPIDLKMELIQGNAVAGAIAAAALPTLLIGYEAAFMARSVLPA